MPKEVLGGAAYVGDRYCEHQAFMQPVSFIHGAGLDDGSVTLQIGDFHISFLSRDSLLAALTEQQPASEIPLAG